MKIFVTGASGFIGGAIATRLVKEGHSVRGLIRDAKRIDELKSFGITSVLGTLDDSEIITQEAKNADAVVNAASSDHLGAVKAILEGIKNTSKIFLHTSGSSIVGDEAMGEASDRINIESDKFNPGPDKVARVELDNLILRNGGVVLCNTMIYGNAPGPKAESVQIPRLAKVARETGVAKYIGKGLNRWSNVHIEDVAALYSLALAKAKPGTFMYVESGEEALGEIARAIGERYNIGLGSLSAEDANKLWGREIGVFALGSNSRVRGRIAKDLGWKPKHTSVTEWIKQELP